MFSRSIHTAANGRISFFLMAEWYASLCVCVCVHACVHIHNGIAIVNNTAINIGGVCIFSN